MTPVALISLLILSAGPVPLGFTSDGRFFVTRDEGLDVVLGAGSIMELEWIADFGFVTDVFTGETQKYLIEARGTPQQIARGIKVNAALPNRAAFEAFLTAAKVKATLSRSSGPLRAEAKLEGSDGAWSKDLYTFKFGPAQQKHYQLSLSVSRGAASAPSAAWSPDAQYDLDGAGDVKVAWSPDGKRVAWLIRQTGMIRNTERTTICFGPVFGPRLEVSVDRKQVSPAAVNVVRVSLGQGGFVVGGEVSQPHAASVVYAAKGFEAQAKQIATLIPGGATVEPLASRKDVDVVIALSASAGAAQVKM